MSWEASHHLCRSSGVGSLPVLVKDPYGRRTLDHLNSLLEDLSGRVPDCAAILNVRTDQRLIGSSLDILVGDPDVSLEHSLDGVGLFGNVGHMCIPCQIIGYSDAQVFDMVNYLEGVAVEDIVMTYLF